MLVNEVFPQQRKYHNRYYYRQLDLVLNLIVRQYGVQRHDRMTPAEQVVVVKGICQDYPNFDAYMRSQSAAWLKCRKELLKVMNKRKVNDKKEWKEYLLKSYVSSHYGSRVYCRTRYTQRYLKLIHSTKRSLTVWRYDAPQVVGQNEPVTLTWRKGLKMYLEKGHKNKWGGGIFFTPTRQAVQRHYIAACKSKIKYLGIFPACLVRLIGTYINDQLGP
uniref:Uncharacterized protein n=1 Tax=viral metagenome TaxID=1070528 RepID=A0A6C0BR61_9ZZZZ